MKLRKWLVYTNSEAPANIIQSLDSQIPSVVNETLGSEHNKEAKFFDLGSSRCIYYPLFADPQHVPSPNVFVQLRQP